MSNQRAPRNLSGCFFRFKNETTGRYENWCYEDLPRSEQKRQLEGRTPEWIESMMFIMADSLVRIGDQLDLGIRFKDEPPADMPPPPASGLCPKHGNYVVGTGGCHACSEEE